MSQFKPQWMPSSSERLVLGTSRTTYLNPRSVQSSVHSYRGFTLKELFKLISQFPSQKLKSVVIIAGFKDIRSTSQQLANDWQCFLDIKYIKFNPSVIV